MDKVVPELDAQRIVLETDSPYLAPVPYRGKRNEPSYLNVIAQKLADYRQVSLTDLIEQTTVNARKLFQVHD